MKIAGFLFIKNRTIQTLSVLIASIGFDILTNGWTVVKVCVLNPSTFALPVFPNALQGIAIVLIAVGGTVEADLVVVAELNALF